MVYIFDEQTSNINLKTFEAQNMFKAKKIVTFAIFFDIILSNEKEESKIFLFHNLWTTIHIKSFF